MTDRTYPKTVAEVLKPRKFKGEVLRALKAFRRAKPWRGTHQERMAKVKDLHADLCIANRINPRLSFFLGGRGGAYSVFENLIVMNDLSVVTYLHEFAHALGKGEKGAVSWSVNLFRRIFPKSWAKLRHEGHRVVRDEGGEG
jgi:hypothetical protein